MTPIRFPFALAAALLLASPAALRAQTHSVAAEWGLAADSAQVPAADGARAEPARTSPVRRAATLGGVEESRLRLDQLSGAAPVEGFLLRSLSTLSPRRAEPAYLAVLAPRADLAWNTQIPFSINDGPVWAGRGGSMQLIAGVEAAAGPVRLVLAPALVWEQNQEFDAMLPEAWDSTQRGRYTAPWLTGAHAADLPYRFGDEGRTALLPGESSLTVRAGPVELGAATESQWWGPGARAALLLSNQAGGFPHALLRTARPLRTPLGALEARWIAGELASSPFDTAAVGRRRSLSAAAVVLTPRAGLSVGAARVVYQPSDDRAALADAGDVFLRWRGAGDTAQAQPFEQMVSVFGRWVFPREGAEVYAEWGRRRLPGFRALLERPESTQGYLLGGAWVRPARGGRLRLAAEAAYLEKAAAYRAEPLASWYAGRAVPQGYTHRGQVLGAFVGPGASTQWVGADFVARRWEAGVGFTRVRWANDAYYDKPGGPNAYRAHDVSILGSLRGGVALGPVWLAGEWTAGRRYNFLFQNPGLDWEFRHLSTSPFNQNFRLSLSAAPPSR
jgi:hypothetical protein